MNIWIINHHALPPDQPGGTRHYDLAQTLWEKYGYNITIFASAFHYSKFEEFRNFGKNFFLEEKINNVNFVWIKTPPYYANDFNRLRNMLAFNKGVKKYLKQRKIKNPDLILGSSVHLFAVDLAWKLSKKYKSRFIVEIRDFWPFTLVELGKISRYHPLVLIFGYLEKKLYKKAEKIITLFDRGHLYLQKFVSREKIVYLPNFFNPKRIKETTASAKYITETNYFNVVYSGSIGISNDLGTLIYALEKIKNDKILLHIFGDGKERKKWENYCNDKKLKNIKFYGIIPKEQLIAELKAADLLWLGMKNTKLYEYGFSMNKIYDYMYAAKPIIISTNLKDNIIEKAKAGITVEAENSEQLAKAIEKFFNMEKTEREKIGFNGKKYLLENLTAEVIAEKFVNEIIKNHK